jgi:hypothetical protein
VDSRVDRGREKILRDEFDRSYRFRDEVTLTTGPVDTSEAPAKNLFDNLPAFRTISFGEQDELTRYLSTVPEDVKNEDVLKWWYEHKHVYPHLYRMALDYHTVPCKYNSFFFDCIHKLMSYDRHQVPLSMWSEFSAKAASFYPIFATDSLRNRRVRFCALVTGAGADL